MKKKILVIILAVVSVFSFCFAIGCKENEQSGNPVINEQAQKPYVQIGLSSNNLSLEKLERHTLSCFVNGYIVSDVVWSSTNQAVATVDGGTVSAIGQGYAVIIATYEGNEARCTVNVSDHGLIPGIRTNVTEEKLYLISEDVFDLSYTVTYNDKAVSDAEVLVDMECTDGSVSIDKNNRITANKVSQIPAIVTVNATWHGLTCNYTFEVWVVSSATARLSNKQSLTLFNDALGGDVYATLLPSMIVDDKVLLQSEYEITQLEYDENIITIEEQTLTVQGLKKGQTEIVATFKELATGLIVQCSLPVSVGLYTYDKSSEITLDVLYLNQVSYYLPIEGVFADIDEAELADCDIDVITDVTESNAYSVPVSKAVDGKSYNVKIADVKALGLAGQRKWKIECDKFSYIVSVPIEETHLAKDILGTYYAEDWDYDVKLSFVNNKDKVEIIGQNGLVVESGTYTVSPWNSANSGNVKITLSGNTIGESEISGYYCMVDGCFQLNLAIGGVSSSSNYKTLCGVPQNLYQEIAGEFTSSAWANSVILDSDGKCEMVNTAGGKAVGEYKLVSTSEKGGSIILNLSTPFNGQSVFEGAYLFGTDTVSITLGVDNDMDKTLTKDVVPEGGADGDAVEYAGLYATAGNSRPFIILLADGTFVFDWLDWTKGHASVGTYEMADGVITVKIESGWYAGEYTGSYREESGARFIDIVIKYESAYSRAN